MIISCTLILSPAGSTLTNVKPDGSSSDCADAMPIALARTKTIIRKWRKCAMNQSLHERSTNLIIVD
jgi:hypothetical protein